MSIDKDKVETERDISYINELRNKCKRSMNEAFSNKKINQSILINENEMSLLNKVFRKKIILIFLSLKISHRLEAQFSKIIAIFKVFYCFYLF